MEDIKDTNVTSEKKFSQEEVNNAVASAKARWEKKLENYVPMEQYQEVQTQLKNAQNELKLPKIQQVFTKMGGKQEAFADIIALNPKLFECADDKALQTELESIKKGKAYCFNPQTFNATVGSDKVTTYTNGSLLRTK